MPGPVGTEYRAGMKQAVASTVIVGVLENATWPGFLA